MRYVILILLITGGIVWDVVANDGRISRALVSVVRQVERAVG